MSTRRRRLILITAGVFAAIVVAVVVFLLSAGESEPRYADLGSSDEGSVPGGRRVYRFGETVRLRTYLTTIEVRPVGFTRIAASQAAGAGVGVDLEIRTVGRAAYRDQPAQAASVTVRGGGEAERVYEPVPGCPGLSDDTVRIPQGETRRFCLAFETSRRPELFVYSAEDGLPGNRGAPEAAAWEFAR